MESAAQYGEEAGGIDDRFPSGALHPTSLSCPPQKGEWGWIGSIQKAYRILRRFTAQPFIGQSPEKPGQAGIKSVRLLAKRRRGFPVRPCHIDPIPPIR